MAKINEFNEQLSRKYHVFDFCPGASVASGQAGIESDLALQGLKKLRREEKHLLSCRFREGGQLGRKSEFHRSITIPSSRRSSRTSGSWNPQWIKRLVRYEKGRTPRDVRPCYPRLTKCRLIATSVPCRR